jgi:DNA repair ATPase RecN
MPSSTKLAETARGLRVELRSWREICAPTSGIEAEPGRLEEVEERLDVPSRLKRKHGGTIESVLAHAEHCRTEIETIEGPRRRMAGWKPSWLTPSGRGRISPRS